MWPHNKITASKLLHANYSLYKQKLKVIYCHLEKVMMVGPTCKPRLDKKKKPTQLEEQPPVSPHRELIQQLIQIRGDNAGLSINLLI